MWWARWRHSAAIAGSHLVPCQDTSLQQSPQHHALLSAAAAHAVGGSGGYPKSEASQAALGVLRASALPGAAPAYGVDSILFAKPR